MDPTRELISRGRKQGEHISKSIVSPYFKSTITLVSYFPMNCHLGPKFRFSSNIWKLSRVLVKIFLARVSKMGPEGGETLIILSPYTTLYPSLNANFQKPQLKVSQTINHIRYNFNRFWDIGQNMSIYEHTIGFQCNYKENFRINYKRIMDSSQADSICK